MINPSAFLDTNVLVYAYGGSDNAERALDLMARPFTVGVQTLNEFALASRRKLQMDWQSIGQAIEQIEALAQRVVVTELQDLKSAVRLAERYGLAFFDSVMIATALAANCTTFYSEDLHHGLVVEERLTILNPFR